MRRAPGDRSEPIYSRTGGSQVEAILKIPIGVVEHNEKACRGAVSFPQQSLWSDPPAAGGVSRYLTHKSWQLSGSISGQDSGDHACHNPGIYRVKPDVHVEGIMVSIVIVELIFMSMSIVIVVVSLERSPFA